MTVVAYYILLCFLGLSLLLTNLFGCICQLLLGPRNTKRLVSPVIYAIIHLYRYILHPCKIGKFTFEGFAEHKQNEPRLYVANHTGLLDAPMALPFLPDVVCVFKAKLKKNPFLSQVPGAIGFVANNEGHSLIRRLVIELEGGRSVLIFPEGTRTENPPMNDFKPGFAIIATKAQVPVQTLLIDNPTGFSGKSRSILRPPLNMPIRYHFRIGAEIKPHPKESAREFSDRVEAYFRAELTRSTDKQMTHRSPPYTVTEENGYCQGHFPGNPIVPGAAQLDWTLAYMKKVYGMSADQFTLRSMKCLQELRPGTTVTITLLKQKDRITAKVVDNDTVYSDSRFQLDTLSDHAPG